MTCRCCCYALVLALVGGCGQDGDYRLRLSFPDEVARTSVRKIALWAAQPEGITCDGFQEGAFGEEALTVLAGVTLDFPPATPPVLQGVPKGSVVFLAEGRLAGGIPILRACKPISIGGETGEVSLEFIWFCKPGEEEEFPGNGRDDDCDGATDECDSDADCEDQNPCTLEDHCQDGTCASTLVDCSHLDGLCARGVCNPQTGACQADPQNENMLCDDELFCTTSDACHRGACTGAARDCDDGDVCTADSCNESTDACDHLPQPRPGEEGPVGDATCSNGVDDDCDQLTDDQDPNCLPCTQPSDCDDLNDCTYDDCVDTVCWNTLVADGATCDDGLFCTHPDRCLAGVCTSTANDCDDDDPCTLDGCDETLGACTHEPQTLPGAEGPFGDATCSNNIDDDCDEQTDADDPSCALQRALCTQDGWCWEHPRPLGDDIFGVWFHEPGSIWMAAAYGMMFRWDGMAFSSVRTGTHSNLRSIWGAASDDFVVVGSHGTVLRWDGAGFVDESGATGENLTIVWGFAADDIWAAGDNGVILHWDGTMWSVVESPAGEGDDLWEIGGGGPQDVWILGWHQEGFGGYMVGLYWDGTAWSELDMELFSFDPLTLWGVSPDDLWFAEEMDFMAHWDGAEMTEIGVELYDAYEMHGTATDDAWVLTLDPRDILRWDGTSWTDVPAQDNGEYLNAIWAGSRDNVWAVGSRGTIHHWEGSTWSLLSQGEYDGLSSIWGADGDHVWAVGGSGTALLRDPVTQTWTNHDIGEIKSLKDVWGSSPTDVWTVGEDCRIYHNDGDGWTRFTPPQANSETIEAISGAATDDVWATGHDDTHFYHWDGSAWQVVWRGPVDPVEIKDIWVQATDDAWAVGRSGVILHWDGSTWSSVPSGTTHTLYSVWAPSSSDAWATSSGNSGGDYAVLHWDGSGWAPVDIGMDISSTGKMRVWGFSANDVWVAGNSSDFLIHWDGAVWSRVHTGAGIHSNGLWGLPQGDLWLVGSLGAILHLQR